jgi:hypothetical protein
MKRTAFTLLITLLLSVSLFSQETSSVYNIKQGFVDARKNSQFRTSNISAKRTFDIRRPAGYVY